MKKVIEFSATWCAPCRMIAPVVEDMKKKYDGMLSIETKDVEEDDDLAAEYKVRNVPTFIFIDEEGKEANRVSGALSKARLTDMFEDFIKA